MAPLFKRKNSSTNLTASPSSSSLANGASSSSIKASPSSSSLAPPASSSASIVNGSSSRSRTASITSSIGTGGPDAAAGPGIKRKSSKILRTLGFSSKNSSSSSNTSLPSGGTPTKPPPAASSSFAAPTDSPPGSVSKRSKSIWKRRSSSSGTPPDLPSPPSSSAAPLSLGSKVVDVDGKDAPRASSPTFAVPPSSSTSTTLPGTTPTSTSPATSLQPNSPVASIKTFSAAAAAVIPRSPNQPHLPSSLSSSLLPIRTRTASASGESLWSYDSDGSSISDSGFVTPDEGLSEVGEEEEEEGHDPEATLPRRTTASSAGLGRRLSRKDSKRAQLTRDAQDAEEEVVVGAKMRSIKSSPIPDAINPNPSVKQEDILAEDLKTCHQVMALFLNSHISEAEKIIKEGDSLRERLYYQVGDAILSTLTGMMTFEPSDLKHAIKVTTYCTELAASHRRHSTSITSRLSGFVKGGGGGNAFIKGMTVVQRHAELVYAETLLMKSVLGIVAGGDWMALVKEALNMRTGDAIYRSLNAFLEHADSVAPGGYDDTIDKDLRSGVGLGTGLSALMLSLLPGKVVKIAEMFGYHSSRSYALGKLAESGGWTVENKEPGITIAEEGLRRPVSDLVLMLYHLIVPSLVPVSGVDIPFAEKVMWWNLERYPNGVFTLFFQSRLHVLQCQPHKSNIVLEKAIAAQSDYIQLQLIAKWDRGVNQLTLCSFDEAASCFEELYTGSNWSKATYLYSHAAALVEAGDDEKHEKVVAAMEGVPKNVKKVAGKTLPIEKFVSRKARKFLLQGRLCLPGLELSYVFGALSHSPAYVLSSLTLRRIQKVIDELEAVEDPSTYGKGDEYWDDWVLAHFLKGFALGTYALPSAITVVSEDDPKESLVGEARKALSLDAIAAFQEVLDNGGKIVLDHWLLFFAHFEMGQIYERKEEWTKAESHYVTVLSGRPPELNPHHKMNGKYSLESALRLKCGTALDGVREKLRPTSK